MEAPSLPSASGTSAHRLTVYGNRSAGGSRRSGVSSSLLGKGYLPSLVPCRFYLWEWFATLEPELTDCPHFSVKFWHNP